MLSRTEICALISGGFVESDSQCVVSIEYESDGKKECLMIPVQSKTPEESPETLMSILAKDVSQPEKNLTVSVYGICGGIRGTSDL